MKITVDITKMLSRGVTVDADSEETALKLVSDAYENGEYPLGHEDCCDVNFSIAVDTASVPVTLDKGIDSRCLILIKSGSEAKTHEGRRLQVAQAAYIDGYLTATGELSKFISRLWKTDKRTAFAIYHALTALRKRQNASYKKMCDHLNDTASWDDD